MKVPDDNVMYEVWVEEADGQRHWATDRQFHARARAEFYRNERALHDARKFFLVVVKTSRRVAA